MLGIGEDQQAVLYAPTWRDNVRNASGSYELVSHFDAARAASRLEDQVFLLRGHSNVAEQRFTAAQRHSLDVTSYPDVTDLYLAADALVTDYSSVMFDFCVTGKPLYFLTPDLEQYRDSVRGFYFDFESEAPGPLVRTTDELVDAMSTPQVGQTSEAYEAFRNRFAALDDGGASARVVRAVWER
ncbi:CDP-glycerol glycerophosphotransferase family protein [Arthrobacter woluwensis]|uniref:CDP-glycerol glycerophosphotransferase family protein n=1 Tax=Arthrobacter woluwensis TaxID=156980 RepID=UPI001FBA8670|nr:CDP-glycerol glycerophosphotransferase family protein [Arthrobacter woluwensis]